MKYKIADFFIVKHCRDFITSFSSALQNSTSSLEEIDFSKNVLDDKKGLALLNLFFFPFFQVDS